MAQPTEVTTPEIEAVVESIISIRESAGKKTPLKSPVLEAAGIVKKRDKPCVPNYYPGYQLAADWLTQTRVHAEKGNFPQWLFENNSPNQTPAELEYVRNNYKQDTLEVFKDFVDTMGRAYHDGNYSINWPVENDQYIQAGLTFREYATTDLPEFSSLETFTFEFLPPLKLMDAEGIVAVLPGEILTKEIEGDVVVDPESLLSPYPEYFHCTKVLHHTSEMVIVESIEKSIVTFNGKDVNEGFVFWVFTPDWYLQVRQKGKKTDNEFDVVEIFQHNLGYIPVMKAGGISVKIDDVNMEQSPFLYAVDTLDRVLIDSTLLASSKANCCYPYRVMIGDPCEATTKMDGETVVCTDGKFRYGGNEITCDACHGTGLKDRITPTGVMLIKANTSTTQGDQIKPTDALFYASPDPATLINLRTEIDYNFTKAYNLLHLKRESKTDGPNADVTATEIADEHKALIASITTNCKQLFEIFRFLLRTIGTIRYGENLKMPEIKEPVSYDFSSVEEFMERITKLSQGDAPSLFIQNEIRDAASRIFFKDAQSRKRFDLIVKTDRLIAMSEMNIISKQAKQLIDKWEVVLHDSILMFLDELEMDNPKFFEQNFAEQKNQLIQKAKDFVSTISTSMPSSANAQSKLDALLGRTAA